MPVADAVATDDDVAAAAVAAMKTAREVKILSCILNDCCLSLYQKGYQGV